MDISLIAGLEDLCVYETSHIFIESKYAIMWLQLSALSPGTQSSSGYHVLVAGAGS